MQKFSGLTVQNSHGDEIAMQTFDDKVLLIVNTASKCGFTPQYEGLEALHQKYADQGLVVLGFPCNQFGQQEPGDDASIQSFCSLNYSVTFPVMKKISFRNCFPATPSPRNDFHRQCFEMSTVPFTQFVRFCSILVMPVAQQ